MLESGIPNLDRILGGGVPEGDLLLVKGPAGSGKTTLVFQLAFHTASTQRKVVYVSTLSEPPVRLVRHLRRFSFFDEAQIGKNLHILHIYPSVKEGLDRTIEALVAVARQHRASLLIIDGLDTIQDLHSGTAELRTFIYDLAAELTALECTTILTSASQLESAAGQSPELTMSDTVITLGQIQLGTEARRMIRLQKVRG